MFENHIDRLIERIDSVHEQVCRVQRELLSLILEVDRTEAWQDSGARDTTHWLAMRYGISAWKANRWIGAAYALEGLPRLSRALSAGDLGIDKVAELTRFATAETEGRLIAWAQDVSSAAVRRRADGEVRASRQELIDAERARFVSWWFSDDGRRLGLEAELPAAQGAVVVRALERVAEQLPVMPGEEDPYFVPARTADALVAVCSARIAQDSDPDRATVVIHAEAEALSDAGGRAEVEDGPVIHPDTLRRLLCTARVQTVAENEAGDVVGLGRISREPSAWMLRQICWRDRGCRFPGCGTRAFTQAHHLVWWSAGGRTDPDNLLLVCSFHHRLLHEHGWSIKRDADGTVRWFYPDGVRYRAGPPPASPVTAQQDLDDPVPHPEFAGASDRRT